MHSRRVELRGYLGQAGFEVTEFLTRSPQSIAQHIKPAADSGDRQQITAQAPDGPASPIEIASKRIDPRPRLVARDELQTDLGH